MGQVTLPHRNMDGQANSWSHVEDNDQAILNVLNGGIDNTNLDGSAAISADNLADSARLGISGSSDVRRGKSIIATEESVTSTSYRLLTTPDEVESVVLPTDGLIVVVYSALFKSSVEAAGSAAIFLNSTQLQGGVTTDEVATQGTNTYHPIYSDGAAGLQVSGILGTIPTTGYAAGTTEIFAAAGTYDVSVQFKASSGSVTAKSRKLWVWTVGF